MHDDSRLVLERINRFLTERIAPAVYRQRIPLTVTSWEVPDEPVPFADAVGQQFAPIAPGAAWGKPWGTTWFHAIGAVPDAWRGASDGVAIELVADLGFTLAQPGFQAEGLVYAPDGVVIKAVEPMNATVAWEELEAFGGAGTGSVDVYIEGASNPDVGFPWDWQPTPMGDKSTAGTAPIYVLRGIDLALRDTTVWELERDVFTLLGLHAQLPQASTRAAQILRALENMCDSMDPHDVVGTAASGREALAAVLAVEAAASAHRITAVGHAHIDSAWLWPTRETIRKCARTFSNVLALMDEHPDFVFACSSAQQYAWVKQFYPELFERIRQRVAEGRFVPVGGMWVESDTNMVGGEAMVRQFVVHPDDYELWDAWDALSLPVLCLRGADSDLLLRETADQMQCRGPHATVMEIPGCGHAPALNTPAQFDLVERFFAADDGPALAPVRVAEPSGGPCPAPQASG